MTGAQSGGSRGHSQSPRCAGHHARHRSGWPRHASRPARNRRGVPRLPPSTARSRRGSRPVPVQRQCGWLRHRSSSPGEAPQRELPGKKPVMPLTRRGWHWPRPRRTWRPRHGPCSRCPGGPLPIASPTPASAHRDWHGHDRQPAGRTRRHRRDVPPDPGQAGREPRPGMGPEQGRVPTHWRSPLAEPREACPTAP